MPHFQTLSSLSKSFRCCIAHPGVPSFISKLHGPGRCFSETNSRPMRSLVARSQRCSQRNVQKLYLGPWNVQKLLLPSATYCYLLQRSWVSFHDFVAAVMTRSECLWHSDVSWQRCLAWCFLDLPYHKGRCHCAVPSCKPCHRHIWCCDLGILVKK